MSDIAELQLLIKKEQQRGDELDEKMTNEQRLPEEAEDKKWKIIRKMLQQQLAELQEQNMIKEQQLIEIQKRKVCTWRKYLSWRRNLQQVQVFLFLYCIFWYLQVCLLIAMSYLYIYMLFWSCVIYFFFDFLIEKDENIS